VCCRSRRVARAAALRRELPVQCCKPKSPLRARSAQCCRSRRPQCCGTASPNRSLVHCAAFCAPNVTDREVPPFAAPARKPIAVAAALRRNAGKKKGRPRGRPFQTLKPRDTQKPTRCKTEADPHAVHSTVRSAGFERECCQIHGKPPCSCAGVPCCSSHHASGQLSALPFQHVGADYRCYDEG